MKIAHELAVEIRPGVLRPDWSVATTSAARQALRGRLAGRTGLLEHWSKPLDAQVDVVWQTLLRLFVRDGRPPRPAEIARRYALRRATLSGFYHLGRTRLTGSMRGGAVAALVGASCCALPLTLAWLGLAGAWIANLGIFVVYRPYITAVALILIGLGWLVAVRGGASRRTLAVLGITSALVGAAVLVTYYETELTRHLIALRRK